MCWYICQHLDVSASMSAYGHVNILASKEQMCWHIYRPIFQICRHFNVLACISACWWVGIYVGIWTCQHICQHKTKCVYIYVGIFITTSTMCRHLNVLAYRSASWCVSIYVSIWTCQHICQHRNKCDDIYVGIFLITSRMCRHLNVLAFMSWCVHICRHMDMSTYLPPSICTCQHIDQHKNNCVDIYIGIANVTSDQHITTKLLIPIEQIRCVSVILTIIPCPYA